MGRRITVALSIAFADPVVEADGEPDADGESDLDAVVKTHCEPDADPHADPTSTPSSGCNGASPDNGPLTNSSGTLATGVAKPFDFPVQHGCNGAGYTAAIAIDDPVNTSYLSTYLIGRRRHPNRYGYQ